MKVDGSGEEEKQKKGNQGAHKWEQGMLGNRVEESESRESNKKHTEYAIF